MADTGRKPRTKKTSRIRIAPSLLASDFSRLKDEIQRAEAAGADWLHVDVMDGHFVPNLTIGPVVVEWCRKVTSLPLDCHLMIEEPEKYAEPFADAGADVITFQAEALAQDYARVRKPRGWAMRMTGRHFYHRERLNAVIRKIRGKGKRVGVAVNPDTPVEVIEFVKRVDMVLLMSVWPGFGGQKFIRSAVPKAVKLRRWAPEIDIEVDGGINDDTGHAMASAGANVIVAGTSTFRAKDMGKAVASLRARVEEGFATRAWEC